MIVPFNNKKLRDEKVLWIRDACLSSIDERRSLYNKRRQMFLYGTDDPNDAGQVKYNRLQAHIDLVASFLYAADHARFSVSAGNNVDESIVQQAQAIQEEWNDEFRDSGLAYLYGDTILWSLINDTQLIKIGWSDERERLTGRMVDPTSFGVFDEAEPDLDGQEAFLHIYRLPWDNAVLRLMRAGMSDRIKDLGTSIGSEVFEFPAVFQAMMVTNTGGANLSGPISGLAPATMSPKASYEAKPTGPTVEFQELWVWDDIHEDYATFIIAEPDIILSDSRETIAKIAEKGKQKPDNYKSSSNIFLTQEHPYVAVTPFTLPNYFWGEAHCDRLTPLQYWSNERLTQIAEILEQQVDPAKVFSGFMGLADEKAGSLGGPGTWVMDALPGAKVDRLTPQMPEDLFAEFKEIGHIFLEASGLTETVTGKGEQGVRGGGHAKQLATTGSARIRKTAVGLEPSLVKIGDLGIRLMMRNSKERLKTNAGQEFVMSQFASEKWNMRVAGHSHSPLFADEARELAAVLLKAQAIDREMFIRLMNPPNADNMIHELRKRMQAEQAARAANPQPPKKSKPAA